LVDPGFAGDLLIPLHNLTAQPYEISGGEGIIWIEFTKTTHNEKEWPARWGKFHPIEQHKTEVGFETYFERASKNNPIQSSIPTAIKEANERSRDAQRSARRAVRTNRLFAGLGVFTLLGAVLATVLTLHSYFQQINANIIAVDSLTSTVSTGAAVATADLRKAMQDTEALKKETDERRKDADDSKQQIRELQENFQRLRDSAASEKKKVGRPLRTRRARPIIAQGTKFPRQ
jgi:hypothetical protein